MLSIRPGQHNVVRSLAENDALADDSLSHDAKGNAEKSPDRAAGAIHEQRSGVKLVGFDADAKSRISTADSTKPATDAAASLAATALKPTEKLPPPTNPSDGPVSMDTSLGEGWTLEALQEAALSNNPAIAQATANVSMAEGIRTQVGLKPNPTIGYTGDQLGDKGTDMNGGFISQDIVLGGKLADNRHVLFHQVQVQRDEVEVQRQRVLTDVRRIFVEALAAQRRAELTRDFRDVAAKGVDLATKRFKAKEGSKPEVLQAEIQLNQIELSLRQAEIALEAAWRQLAAVVGDPELPRTVLVGDLGDNIRGGEDWESQLQGLFASSPELRVAEEQLRVAQANLDRQLVQWVPNLNVQLANGYDAGTNGNFSRVQLGIPIPLRNANEGNICAARADCSRAAANVDRLRTSLRLRWAEVVRGHESASTAVARFQDEILPKAEESLKLSEKAYLSGEFDFLQVLIVRRTFFDSNLEYVLARKELALNQANVDGLLLTGGFDAPMEFNGDDGLRGQSLSGQ